MAIPPGNKQVGQISVAVSYCAAVDTKYVVSYGAVPTAIVTNTTASAVPPTAIKNNFVGSVSLTLVSRAATGRNILQCNQLMAVAILRYAPPTSTYLQQLAVVGFVTNIPSSSLPPTPPKNIMAGQVAVAIASAVDPLLAIINVEQIIAVAIVHKFQPRNEHVTMNIEYAANAKLNTEDLL